MLGNRAERKEKCLRWSMTVALGGTLKVGDDQPVAEEASAEPDSQQKQDVLCFECFGFLSRDAMFAL